MDKLIFFIILPFSLTLLILKLFISKFKYFFLDLPNKRSSHKLPTPTSGGISFVLSTVIFSSFSGYLIPLLSLPLAITGIIDDKVGLKSNIRYGFQVITSIFILSLLNKIDLSNIVSIFYTIFLIILGTSIINIINFMDGLDGLITLAMIIFFLVLAISYSSIYLILLFTLIPFLFYNWHPSQVFMGDVGSTFLGAIVFAAIIERNSFTESLSLIILICPLLLDASICIIRRFLNGQNIFSPHKLHLYQRLHQAKFSHKKVSLIFNSAILFLGMLFFINNIYILSLGGLLVFFLGITLDLKYAVPFGKKLY